MTITNGEILILFVDSSISYVYENRLRENTHKRRVRKTDICICGNKGAEQLSAVQELRI